MRPCWWVGEQLHMRPFCAANICGFRLDLYENRSGDAHRVGVGPEVSWNYGELRGLFPTRHGRWPIPMTLVQALVANEICGEARRNAVYDVFWMGLNHSKDLQDWMNEHYPAYWSSIKDLL